MRRSTGQLAPVPFARSFRRAFTLVELLMVIVVIAILAAFILPAVMGSWTSARITQVTTELRGMETAIAQFKALYGVEPPSRIRLYQSGTGSPSWVSHTGSYTDSVTGATVSHDAERARSLAIIKRIWPQFDFSKTRNFGAPNGFVSLHGAECLVFFLGGGVVASPTGAFAMTGFSKNPMDPFAPASGSESRDGPFFEFKPSQLKTTPNSAENGIGILVYYDPFPNQKNPYIYLSSYDGRGYQLADLLVNPQTPPVAAPLNQNLFDVYRVGTTAIAQKAKSFQLISPGANGDYGIGGAFDAGAVNSGLGDPRDYDNITNFTTGLLKR